MLVKFALRVAKVLGATVVTVGVALPLSQSVAQVPTPEQIRMFQSLPQAQKDAILQQLGIGSGGAGQDLGTQSGNGLRSDQIVVNRPGDNTSQPDANSSAMDAASRLDELREPKIKGHEQLLIDLMMPAPASSAPAPDANTAGTRPSADQATSADRRQAFEQRSAENRARAEERSPVEDRRLESLRMRILTRNPYELSDVGVLQLPGFEPIALGGLTAKDAQRRLALDPQLRDFTVSVTLLRVNPLGVNALKPFGAEMFRAGATAFVPGTDIPVPPNYRVGAGDVMGVQLYGQQSKDLTLPVARDGILSFPEIGPISVGGLSFANAQSQIESRVRQQLTGTQARVRLTELRPQRVLVIGDAEKPGSYVVSALANVTNALFASGGVKPIGSLRTLEVRRDGHLIRRLDLYDVLLHGNMTDDVMLQSGDVVFVPSVGPVVAIDGEVRRPAIYELVKERTLVQVVALAGGLSPKADASVVTVDRIGEHGDRSAVDVNLATEAGQNFVVQNGDNVHIAAVRPVVDNGIALEGHVYRPGVYAWRQGLHLSDVVRSIDDLKPRADAHYVLIRREETGTRRVSVVSADLGSALAQPSSAANIPLAPRDRIFVFDLISPRDRIVDVLLDEIRVQSRPEDLAGLVYVDGRINAPGTYPLEPGMRVTDLLRAGGGLEDAAYANSAELASYTVINGERRRADIRQIDLAAARRGDLSADVQLQPYDLLTIKLTPEWERQERVELLGEVRFPGTYLVRRGETLSSAIERAGGLTSLAFAQGAVFTREELKRHERDELNRLATRLQADVATLSLQASQTNPNAAQSVAAGQGLLDQLRAAQPVGRLIIDLDGITSKRRGELDVTLRNGDRLVVPRATEEVSVLGEVQNPTGFLFHAGLTRDQLIGLSGGTTVNADKKRIYVVHADGSVFARAPGWGWGNTGNIALKTGDTVVVPLDAERMRPLPLWTAVTTIVYNLAIAAAAIGRF